MRSILAFLLVLLSAAMALAVAQQAQQPVGPSAQWCRDTTMHPTPGRYRVITVRTGDAADPQTCIEVLDTQQTPVCRIRFDCEQAT